MAIRAYFTKEDIGISINTLKITQNHLSLRKTKLKLQFKKPRDWLQINMREFGGWWKCSIPRLWLCCCSVWENIIATHLAIQLVKNLSAVQVTWVWSLSQEDPLEKGKTPVYLPGEYHGQRILVGYSPGSCKSWTQLSVSTTVPTTIQILCIEIRLCICLHNIIKEKRQSRRKAGIDKYSMSQRRKLQWAVNTYLAMDQGN